MTAMTEKTVDSQRRHGSARPVWLLPVVLLVLAGGVMLWLLYPADSGFLHQLEACAAAGYEAARADLPEPDYLATQKSVRWFRWRRFTDADIREMHDLFLGGYDIMKRAARTESVDRAAWNRGLRQQSEAVKTLWEQNQIHLDKAVYLHYAMIIIEDNLMAHIAKLYRVPEMHVGATNYSTIDLNSVELDIHFNWETSSETVTVKKATWRPMELWDITVAYPLAAFDAEGDTSVSLDIRYAYEE